MPFPVHREVPRSYRPEPTPGHAEGNIGANGVAGNPAARHPAERVSRSPEARFDLAQKVARAHRLAHKTPVGRTGVPIDIRIPTREIKDAQIWPHARRLAGEIEAVDPRQFDVGKEKVDLSSYEDPHRLVTIGCC